MVQRPAGEGEDMFEQLGSLQLALVCPAADDRVVTATYDFMVDAEGAETPEAAVETARRLEFPSAPAMTRATPATFMADPAPDRLQYESIENGETKLAVEVDRLLNRRWIVSRIAVCNADFDRLRVEP